MPKFYLTFLFNAFILSLYRVLCGFGSYESSEQDIPSRISNRRSRFDSFSHSQPETGKLSKQPSFLLPPSTQKSRHVKEGYFSGELQPMHKFGLECDPKNQKAIHFDDNQEASHSLDNSQIHKAKLESSESDGEVPSTMSTCFSTTSFLYSLETQKSIIYSDPTGNSEPLIKAVIASQNDIGNLVHWLSGQIVLNKELSRELVAKSHALSKAMKELEEFEKVRKTQQDYDDILVQNKKLSKRILELEAKNERLCKKLDGLRKWNKKIAQKNEENKCVFKDYEVKLKALELQANKQDELLKNKTAVLKAFGSLDSKFEQQTDFFVRPQSENEEGDYATGTLSSLMN